MILEPEETVEAPPAENPSAEPEPPTVRTHEVKPEITLFPGQVPPPVQFAPAGAVVHQEPSAASEPTPAEAQQNQRQTPAAEAAQAEEPVLTRVTDAKVPSDLPPAPQVVEEPEEKRKGGFLRSIAGFFSGER